MTTNSVAAAKHAVPQIVILVLLAGAAFVRLARIADPPIDFHAPRQYHSALIARGYYVDRAPDFSAAERANAHTLAAARHQLEPPFLERVAASLYALAGREALWLPRSVSVLAWLVGGWFLALLAGRWFDAAGVLGTLALYLFAPYAAVASRAFQPDPLMVSMLIIAAERATAAADRPRAGSRALATAVATAAVAILLKPMAIPFALAIFVTATSGPRWMPRAVRGVAATAVASVPAAFYYVATLVTSGRIEGELAGRIHPQLLISAPFWQSWMTMITRVTLGWPVLAVMALAWPIAAPYARRLLAGLWIAYVVFGLVFAYHIHTHDYYSLPLIPIAALTFGYALQVVRERVATVSPMAMQWVAIAVMVAVMIPGVSASLAPLSPQSAERVARFEELRKQLSGAAVVGALDGDYGLPLAFHSRLAVATWPMGIDFNLMKLSGTRVPTFDEIVRSFDVSYFVVTLPEELQIQPELRDRLSDVPELPSAVGANRESVRVYDLRNATLAVRPGAMRFTKVAESTMQTPPQSLVVQVGGFKPVDWTLQVPAGAPIQATQRSARGSGRVDVALAPDSPTEGAVVIQVRADQRDPIAVPVRWRTVKREMLQPPIGSIDVPPGDTISFPSSISGWTLDDVGVTQILFVGVDGHGRRIELATTHDFGWRSDLERIYQHLPGGGRGAWSQLLPPPSADVAAVQVVAEDVDGHRTVIGSRRVVK